MSLHVMDEASRSAEWDGSAYHRLGNPQFAWGEKVLARLQLRGDETILDAGCGSGRVTAELLERVPRGRVIAVDNSESMLAAARGFLEPRFGGRVSFVRADLQTLRLDGTADVIFSTATFHWIPDHLRLFGNLYRALKPGGWLVAQCGGGPNIARLRLRTAALAASPTFAPYFASWHGPWNFADDVTTFERLVAAGFADVETGLEATPTVLSSAGEYREFVANVILLVHLARLPGDGLRDELLDALVEQASADEPPFLLDYWRLNLRARRSPA